MVTCLGNDKNPINSHSLAPKVSFTRIEGHICGKNKSRPIAMYLTRKVYIGITLTSANNKCGAQIVK